MCSKQQVNGYEEAVKDYKKVVEVEPDRAQAYYNLGKAYLKIGDKDLALEEYEILKTLDEELANELIDFIEE